MTQIIFDANTAKEHGVKIAVLLAVIADKKPRSFGTLSGLLPFFTDKELRLVVAHAMDSDLIEKQIYLDANVYQVLKSGDFEHGCHFFGYNKAFLDKHHYPVRAKDGGTETIDLCANCHREFHQLADHGLYRIKSSK